MYVWQFLEIEERSLFRNDLLCRGYIAELEIKDKLCRSITVGNSILMIEMAGEPHMEIHLRV